MVPLNASRNIQTTNSTDNHISSPENSDSMEHNKHLTKKNGTIQDGKDDKQKTIRLRIPSTNESDQLIVSLLKNCGRRKMCIESNFRIPAVQVI